MGFLKTGASALGKLVIIGVLAAAFFAGLFGVIYLSLRGEEVKVPEIVGKDWFQSEKEIADLGLKIKKRATRYSQEKPNTILEQLPRPGETVKTGQTILVVLSEANPEGSEAPATVNKETVNSETDEGTDITPEKPKANKNSNVKKAQTTRDVISNKSNTNSNLNINAANSNSTNSNAATNSAGNKNSSTTPANKTATPTNSNKTEPPKPNTNKPAPAKSPAGIDTRTRKVP